jgi:hypothetical protein
MNVDVVFVNHTADHSPGEYVVVDANEARRLVDAAMARYATEDDVAEARAAAQQAEQDAAKSVDAANDKLADAKAAKK